MTPGLEFFHIFPLSDRKTLTVSEACRAEISLYIPLPVASGPKEP